MCRIFDEDQQEKVAFYKNANASHGKEKKPMTHSRAKPYSAPLEYENHYGGQRTSGGHHLAGGSSQLVNRVSQPAGRGGSGAPAIVTTPLRCRKCGRLGHNAHECTYREVTCFNYQVRTLLHRHLESFVYTINLKDYLARSIFHSLIPMILPHYEPQSLPAIDTSRIEFPDFTSLTFI
eukprot:XP_014629189.1 uncharacterized protein LOC102659975 [Glycine max]